MRTPAPDHPDSPVPDPVTVELVRSWVAESSTVVALVGAGISTDSGIPDFRGPRGVWTKDPKAERTSHIDHYVADPEVRRIAWQQRLHSPTWRAEANAGHRALVELERQGRLHALITQNIDGLHQRAGSDPGLVIEVHGTMREAVCLDCGARLPMGPVLDRVRAGEDDPPCRSCGGMLKSATVSFGQALDPDDLRRSAAAAAACDLLLCIGTTLTVFPIAEVPHLAKAAGARVVVLNGEPTAFDHEAHAVLRGPIGTTLPAVVAAGGPG